MNHEQINNLLLISSCGLMIAGIIFLIISLVGTVPGNWPLASALGCIVLSNLFRLIKNQRQ